MRGWISLLLAASMAVSLPLWAGDKLTLDERIEIVRGLTAEFATVKAFLPRSKKALPFKSDGTYDQDAWKEAGDEMGPAARVGDTIQISKVKLGDDKIELEINGGVKGGRKWYDRIEVGMGNRTSPISSQVTNPTTGTNIALQFDKPLQNLTSAEVKKLLAPILDFEKRSATELYTETLPPEVQKAITEKKAIEGMDRDQVLLAMGHPRHKTRETKDGLEVEDWVYGQAPGRITFVTFNGSKVVKVKETYAGLGAVPAPPLKAQD